MTQQEQHQTYVPGPRDGERADEQVAVGTAHAPNDRDAFDASERAADRDALDRDALDPDARTGAFDRDDEAGAFDRHDEAGAFDRDAERDGESYPTGTYVSGSADPDLAGRDGVEVVDRDEALAEEDRHDHDLDGDAGLGTRAHEADRDEADGDEVDAAYDNAVRENEIRDARDDEDDEHPEHRPAGDVVDAEVVEDERVEAEVADAEAAEDREWAAEHDDAVTEAQVVTPAETEPVDAVDDTVAAGPADAVDVAPAASKPGSVDVTAVGAVWTDGAVDGLRDRWRELQLRFIDEPRSVADEADRLVGEAVDTITNALQAQRRELADWQNEPGDDTERLRAAVRGYRDYLDRLLGM